MADTATNAQTLNYSLTNKTFWFTTEVPGWSIGNVSQCKLFDQFTLTPGTANSEFELKLATHILSCQWAKKGDFWLQSSLGMAASYSTASGASGSLQLNSGLYWQPTEYLRVNFGLTLNGTVDRNGFTGTAHFHDTSILLGSTRAVLGTGLGIHF